MCGAHNEALTVSLFTTLFALMGDIMQMMCDSHQFRQKIHVYMCIYIYISLLYMCVYTPHFSSFSNLWEIQKHADWLIVPHHIASHSHQEAPERNESKKTTAIFHADEYAFVLLLIYVFPPMRFLLSQSSTKCTMYIIDCCPTADLIFKDLHSVSSGGSSNNQHFHFYKPPCLH